MRKCFFSLLLILSLSSTAQNLDKKFEAAFLTLSDNTAKVDSLNELCSSMERDEKTISYQLKVKELAEKLNYQKGIAQSLNNIGIIYKYLGKGKEALESHYQALKIRKDLGDKKDISSSYNNIGNAYDLLGDKKQAIEFHIKAFKLREELNDSSAMARSLSNIGSAYLDVPDYYKAINYGFKAVKLYEALGEISVNHADVLNNIGIAYDRLNELDKALPYYQKALEIQKDLGNKEGVARILNNIAVIYHKQGQDTLNDKATRETKLRFAIENYYKILDILLNEKDNHMTGLVYNNIGNIYWELKDFSSAIKALNKSLDIYKAIDNKNGIISTLNSLAIHLRLQKKYNESIKYAHQALSIADSIQNIEEIKNACEILSANYREAKQFEKSLYYYMRYTQEKDKLNNIEGARRLSQEEAKREFEKQEQKLKAEQEKERIKAEEKNRRQKLIIWSSVSGLLLVAAFSIFILNRWRVTQKQKKIIEQQNKIVEEQRKLVEEKNKSITDSINYAHRIQRAILPETEKIVRAFPDSFIFFHPRDIVSGDFYWYAELTRENSSYHLIAAADCTGHGVPGAFMSMINTSLLNEAINAKKLLHPNEILNDVRAGIIRSLKQKGETGEQKDGMDIALVLLEMNGNSIKAEFAGANNSMYLIRKSDQPILEEIEPDSMPVAISDYNNDFTNKQLSLQSGDVFYLLTDGYADQFGGPKGKKFKYTPLKQLLLSIHKKPMNEQKEILEKTFFDWKGNLEQIDDVLVIGIKV